MNEVMTFGDKFYLTANASIVDDVDSLPREMASQIKDHALNPSFIWVAGRYVQAGAANKNGHFWTIADLEAAEDSIRYTPLNVNHRYEKPVGMFVETKMVERASSDSNPEIQALSIVWGANFPEVAAQVRQAHDLDRLWYSMECVAEQVQCKACDRTFAFRSSASDMCEHLSTNKAAPRRFINTTFLGGALIMAPERPAWQDADITDVARELTKEYALGEARFDDAMMWDELMKMAQS